MEDLIKALQIFAKYDKGDCIDCAHDAMYICIDEDVISEDDIQELERLSFTPEGESFVSYRFGSC